MTTSPAFPPTSYEQPKTSGLAVASLILGLVGFCVPISTLASLVCGHMAISAIRKSSGALGGRGLAMAGTILGYVTLLYWIVVAVIFFTIGFAGFKMAAEMEKLSRVPFPISLTPVPAFPPLPEFQTIQPSQVRVAQIDLESGDAQAGSAMSFRVYLPPGDAAPKSLPCVLIAPAGTNLISGASLEPLDGDSYHDESLPYAEAGMAVVMYSIDGEDPELEDEDDPKARMEEMKRAFDTFRNAGAGAVNGRNALEFALARLPMVDPRRIYSAGHSSAATLSLVLAAHEPRLNACIAYAPAVDLAKHFGDNLGLDIALGGFSAWKIQASPVTHAHRIQVPVFLFFAENDEVVSPSDISPFIDTLRLTNPEVTVKTVPSGGHYESMIDEGIPAGIEWLRSLPVPE